MGVTGERQEREKERGRDEGNPFLPTSAMRTDGFCEKKKSIVKGGVKAVQNTELRARVAYCFFV